MRKLLTIFFVFLSFIGISQPVTNRSSNVITVKDERWMAGKNMFAPVYADTTSANLEVGIDSCGALIFTKDYNGFWYRACSPKRWIQILPGGSSTSDTLAWRIGGNSIVSITGPPYLGTKEYKEIIFITDNKERAVIPPNGIVFDESVIKRPLLFDTVTKVFSWGNPYATQQALEDTAANIRGDFPTYTGVTQQQLDDTSAAIRGAIPSQPNQLLFGGEVTEVSPLQFFITSAQYRIGGRTFTSPDTTITLAAAGDSNRIDVFVVDTLNRVVAIPGTQSSNPVPPSVDPLKELLLNFVFVGTDTVYQPVITPQYWTQSGADIININAGNVLTGNQFRATGGFNVTPALVGTTFNGIRYAASNTVDMFVGNNNVSRWWLVGNGTGAFYDLFGTFNPASGTGTGSAIKLRTTVAAAGANAKNYYQLEIVPTYTQGVLGTGTLAGVYYNPTINSLNTSTHYAWWSTSGGFRAQGLSYSADTTYLGLCIDANGNFYRCPRSTGSGGGGGITRQELIDTANAIRSSLASFQAAMYDSLTAIRGAIPAAGVSQSALNDTAAAIRNYTTENIRYVAPDSGIVMTVVGDTAKFSVDTAYLKNVVHPYKSYVAKLSQSGTNPPVANIIYNDLGNITWSRLDVGSYLAELSGSFQPEKTFIINQVSYGVPLNGQLGLVYTTYLDADSIGVKSVDAFVSGDSPFSDDIIYDTYIEIRVYN